MGMVVAFDCETEMIGSGNPVPEVICVSYAAEEGSGVVNPGEGSILLRDWLESDNIIVGHNVQFDFACMTRHSPKLERLIFDKYHRGQVMDTMIREMLLLIRNGEFKHRKKGQLSLAGLARKYADMDLDKSEDGWRTRYTELKDIPISQWPDRAVKYAEEDAIATLLVYKAQEDSPDQKLQMAAAYALYRLSIHGIITDGEAVQKLKAELTKTISGMKDNLEQSGILRWGGTKKKPKLMKDTKKIMSLVELELRNPPKTDSGRTKIDAKTLRKTKNLDLHALVEYTETEKLLTTYVPLLEHGTDVPINARFNVLVDTGRTSCSGPNLQNQPRKAGVRECFIPRPGYIFAACDYDAAELRALAQVNYHWFKQSKMRDVFIDGLCPHVELAAQIIDIPPEEARVLHKKKDKEFKEHRQFAKIPNFGFPGGLGVAAFVKFAEGYGYELTEYRAKQLKDKWFATWPEMRAYFERISSMTDQFSAKRVIQLYSNRIRGGTSFTQGANSMFQGLVADGAKDALFHVVEECYVDKGTALYGCKPVCFIHDEILLEVPEDLGHDAAMRLSEVMNKRMQLWIRDVPITSEAHLMTRWFKNAGPVFDNRGRLVPWRPE